MYSFIDFTNAMKLFGLFVISIIYPPSSSLLCMNTESIFQQSLTDLDLGTVLRTFKRAINYDDSSTHLCHIRIDVDYTQLDVTILLTGQYQHRMLNDAQVYFVTELLFINEDNFTAINSIESACSEEQCEAEFIHNYMRWLVEANYDDLKMNMLSWMTERINVSGEYLNIDIIRYISFPTIYKVSSYSVISKMIIVLTTCV